MILDENLFNDVEYLKEEKISPEKAFVKRFKLSECISKEFDNLRESYSDYLDPQSEVGMFIREFAKSIINGKALTDKQQKIYDLISELVINNIDESLTEDLASYIQKLHDEDEYLWNLHHTNYSWLYDELDKYSDDWRETDSKHSIADVIRMMPEEKQREIYNKLVEPYVNESLKEDLTFNNKEIELIKKYLEKELGHTWTDKDDEKQIRFILNKIHNIDESLKEDVDDVVMIEVPDVIADIEETDITPKGPDVGVDTGIADMLLDLINGENDTIKDYNIFKANLESHPEFISVIEDITNEENNHIGMLQTLLKQISPNVETIKQGEAEAEKDLIDDSQSFEVSDFEVDDSFDNGFGGIYV